MPTPREAYTNTVEQRPYGGERLQAGDFGAAGEMLGRAAAGFGQDLNRVASDWDEIQQADATLKAQEVGNKYALLKQSAGFDGEDAHFNLTSKRAAEGVPQFETTLSKLDQAAVEELKGNPRASRLYQQQAAARNQDLLLSARKHAGEQRETWTQQVAQSGIETAIEAAATAYTDPVQVEQNLGTAGNIAYAEGIRRGLDPAGAELLKKSARTKAAMAAANQMELKSAGESQAFLKTVDGIDRTELAAALKQLADPAAQERARDGGLGKYMAVKSVRTFDTGTSIENTEGVATSTPLPPTNTMHALIAMQESGNREYWPAGHPKAGQRVTSSAGAQGIMQVMPATQRDPGYGIRPTNGTPADTARVGRELYDALVKKYNGNVVLALTAYNWGPGNVDGHIKKTGDPRKGGISDAAWLASVPVEEAREYSSKVLHRGGVTVGKSAQSPANQPSTEISFKDEIDLEAVRANILADDELTTYEKDAYIKEATRQSGEHDKARARQEDRVADTIQARINSMPEGSFTSLDQLSLAEKRALDDNPSLFAQVQAKAQNNQDRINAERAQNQTQIDKLAGNYRRAQINDAFYSNPAQATAAWERDRIDLMGVLPDGEWNRFDTMAKNVRTNGGLPKAEVGRSVVVSRVMPVLKSAKLTIGDIPKTASKAVRDRMATRAREAEDAVTEAVQMWQRENPSTALTESKAIEISQRVLTATKVREADGDLVERKLFEPLQPGEKLYSVNIPTKDFNAIQARLKRDGRPNSPMDVQNVWLDMAGR